MASPAFRATFPGVTQHGVQNHGSHFEKHHPVFNEGGGSDDAWIDDDGPPTCVELGVSYFATVYRTAASGLSRCAAHDRNVEAAENEKASEERLSTEKPAVTPAWMVLT
ncbi:hypothetical protein B0H14DRAFT_3483535 [Mycena olivaceomarginata]|nr:hypothetical protein B0H14DRAFT_3483535 [Mycena olivaceomarginata]